MPRLRLAEILTNGDVGGGQRATLDLAESLNRDLVEVEFFFLGHGAGLAEHLTSLGFRSHSLGWSGGASIGLRLDLIRGLRRFEPDVVHDHSLPILFRPWIRLLLPRAILVSSEHYPHQLWRRSHGKWLAYWISRAEYTLLDRVIVHSSFVADQVVQGYGVSRNKISVIPLGIDLGKFDPACCNVPVENVGVDAPNNYRIGYIGRISSEDKGVDLIPLVVKAMVDRGVPDFEMIVAGDGPDRRSIEETCRGIGVSQKIKWLGWRQDIPSLLAGLDLLVQPSRMETFGLAAVEALALGIRVVASDVGGVREIIGDSPDAKLVTGGDIEGFAAAILEFKKVFGRSRSMTSRGFVVERFDRGRFARDMQDVLCAVAPDQIIRRVASK